MMEAGREELLEILWDKVEPSVFIEKDAFINALADWHFYPVVVDGVIIAVVGENGPEMHFESLGTGKTGPRSTMREILQRIIDKYGYVATKTPIHEVRQCRFNELIGFERTGADEYDIYYRMTKLRGL